MTDGNSILVLIISEASKDWGEATILEYDKCNFKNYALSNCKKIWNKFDCEERFNFALVEQTKWDVLKDALIRKIESLHNNDKFSKIIIWTHNSGGPDGEQLKVDFIHLKNVIEEPIYFSHVSEYEKSVSALLECFAKLKKDGKDVSKEFSDIVQSYLKIKQKPHLIALSILCQGYLAAHGKLEGLPNNLKEKAQQNWLQVNQSWWQPALGEELKGKELIKELEALNKITVFGKLKNGNNHQAVINALISEKGDQLANLVTTIHEFLKDNIFLCKR